MASQSHCEHCHEKIIIPVFLSDEESDIVFCCEGCKTVYEILQEKNLTDYYRLREQTAQTNPTAVKISGQKYKYLDDPEFKQKYTIISNQTLQITFYLENIHCLACLWLIEKLPEINHEVLNSKLNMSKSTVDITLLEDAKISQIAQQLESLGYPPHPIMEEKELKEHKIKEDHKDLIRIAIAFFSTGNIMLMAFAVYAGATGHIEKYFNWISLFLFFPIIFYCAIPFYRNAFSSLKNKLISIDLPIVIALLFGGTFSLFSVLNDDTHIYFDSLSMLIFLLLTSRFLLKKSQQKGLEASELSNFFTHLIAYKVEDDQTLKEVNAKFLLPNDIIYIYPGDTIPADAQVIQGTSKVNNSLLTGEVIPQPIQAGEYIFSGTINLDQELTAKVIHTGQDSKLGQILSAVEHGWNQKTKIVSLTDQIAKYFVLGVFLLSFFVFSYFIFQGRIEDAFIRTLTLVIITCPCALGLTTPLTLTISLAKLAKKGIIIKNELVLEMTNKIKNIIFDKTGTLTHGKFQVIKWESLDRSNYFNVIYQLESKSQHPIAKSITDYLKAYYLDEIKQSLELTHYTETPGIGPSGTVHNDFYELKQIKAEINSNTLIGLYKNQMLVTKIHLSDSLKPDAYNIIKKLKNLNYNIYLLSGDNKLSVQKVASDLEILPQNTFYEQSPQDKQEFIKKTPNSMMLGDGANDAIALSFADIGVAIHGSVDISLRASSVFMATKDLQNILRLLISGKETLHIIKRNLIFSLLYNSLGLILAIQGYIDPLAAAIIMPLSSFTVLASTLIGTKKLRQNLS